jgi:hypothetical protein
MLTQERLFDAMARRVAEATASPTTLPATITDLGAAVESAPAVAAVAVVRRFEPAAFARSAMDFALGLDAERRQVWFRAFTRTLFLSGNPANLAQRFPVDRIAADGSVGWLAPAPVEELLGVRRLLKLFDVTAELDLPPEVTVEVPGSCGPGATRGEHLRVYMATAGLRMPDYLVHLNHTLAEAALTGLVFPGDRVTLVHVPRITAETGPYDRLRVHWDTRFGVGGGQRLRAYSGLKTVS